MTPAQSERRALCDLFIEVGPDAPTLCAGWTTRDLAAHLIIRERRPDAAIGILSKRFAPYSEKVRKKVAQQEWATLVNTVRTGPPRLSPMRLSGIDKLTNTLEYFVHVEDVRRAVDNWSPRVLDKKLLKQLHSTISRGAKLMVRKAPCGLILQSPEAPAILAKKGDPGVTVTGDIGEIILFIYGRQARARVQLTGPEDLQQALQTTSFGI